MTRVMLIGSNGQVGVAIRHHIGESTDLVACDRSALDLEQPEQIVEKIKAVRPDVIINAGAYTAVDNAEEDEERCFAINARAPGIIAEQAKELGSALIHYSTDYVYDGRQREPYCESNSTNPLGVYGKSKLLGDSAIQQSGVAFLIFRTSWVYSSIGHNFYLTIKRLLIEKEKIKVVDDQKGAPTSADSIAAATVDIINSATKTGSIYNAVRENAGTYHMTCGGETSWYGFAQAIKLNLARTHDNLAEIIPVTSTEFPVKAQRPMYSVLDNSQLKKTFKVELPHWTHALDEISA